MDLRVERCLGCLDDTELSIESTVSLMKSCLSECCCRAAPLFLGTRHSSSFTFNVRGGTLAASDATEVDSSVLNYGSLSMSLITFWNSGDPPI